jgi:hypothetical protein
MWFWVGVGLGSFITLSLFTALVFARILATLNGSIIELLDDRAASESPIVRSAGQPSGGVSDRRSAGRQEPLSRASATR